MLAVGVVPSSNVGRVALALALSSVFGGPASIVAGNKDRCKCEEIVCEITSPLLLGACVVFCMVAENHDVDARSGEDVL